MLPRYQKGDRVVVGSSKRSSVAPEFEGVGGTIKRVTRPNQPNPTYRVLLDNGREMYFLPSQLRPA